MTRDDLAQLVSVRQAPDGTRYIRLLDIPQPWREQFDRSLRGAQVPVIPGESGSCVREFDWSMWLRGKSWYGRPEGLES